MRTLAAWIEDRRIGEFTETAQTDGSNLFAFEYEIPPDRDIVSLTMVPLAADSLRFEMRSFPPPFDMILPEGERRLIESLADFRSSKNSCSSTRTYRRRSCEA